MNETLSTTFHRLRPLIDRAYFDNKPQSPKHPLLFSAESRLATFSYQSFVWPGPSNHKVSPKSLADQGFACFSLKDTVYCFHGDHYLHKWPNLAIDPWKAHAAWFPDCKYVELYTSNEEIQKQRIHLASLQNRDLLTTFDQPPLYDELRDQLVRVNTNVHFMSY